MSESIQLEKEKIRKRILQLLRNQKEEDRLNKSLSILKQLFNTPQFKAAKTVLFYASFDGEVDTYEMMKQSLQLGKKIALPIIDIQHKKITPALVHDLQKDLVSGPYGIQEPRFEQNRVVPDHGIDLSVVPGIAFDRVNHRLGRGAGYYDRFLSRLAKDTPSIGLAFDFQLVDHLPRLDHDVPLSGVISN